MEGRKGDGHELEYTLVPNEERTTSRRAPSHDPSRDPSRKTERDIDRRHSTEGPDGSSYRCHVHGRIGQGRRHHPAEEHAQALSPAFAGHAFHRIHHSEQTQFATPEIPFDGKRKDMGWRTRQRESSKAATAWRKRKHDIGFGCMKGLERQRKRAAAGERL